jgi:hypothetical protein
MMCHGVIGSNVITDFGYGTANFNPGPQYVPTPSFFSSPYFQGAGGDGDGAYGDHRGGWQSATIHGSLYIPQVAFTPAMASSMFGITINQSFSLMDFVQLGNTGGGSNSLASTVTPPIPMQSPVVQLTSLNISYPKAAEIVALAPTALQTAGIGFSAIQVSGQPASSATGLSLDTSGNFVRNTTGSTFNCTGDVVVLGTLFLKNLQISTNANGCHLYVSQSVFIQGPITYTSSVVGQNIQISSARAIVMGFSLTQLGASSTAGQVRILHKGDNNIGTPGGNFARFAQEYDVEYDTANLAINGVTRTTFFDNIVLDAKNIGSELQDAGDAAAIASVPAGATVNSEPRLSINYQGLLLNAPHVHSRYAGSLKGVVISEIAMFARNPSSTNPIEQFVYDPVFDGVSSVLPALSTQVLTYTP